jgi:hypothetical protein
MGYHVSTISSGVLGEASKIQEELNELVDAENQGVRVLMLCELSDIVGAVDAYLEKYFPGFDIHDLVDMAMLTKSAFKDGERK